jgi:hypothetical protein
MTSPKGTGVKTQRRKRGEDEMKTWLWRGTPAAAVALPALSGIAQAQKKAPKRAPTMLTAPIPR